MRPLSTNGQKSVQINVRLTPEELRELEAFMGRANEQAREMGLPGVITISSIVRMWIKQHLSQEGDRSGKRLSDAPHLQRASDLLRGTRK